MKKFYFSYVVTFEDKPHLFGYTVKQLKEGVVTIELVDELAKELYNAAIKLNCNAVNCTILSWQELASSNN